MQGKNDPLLALRAPRTEGCMRVVMMGTGTFAEPTLDAPLAVAQPFSYRSLHLKCLAHEGKQVVRFTTLFSGTAEVFQPCGCLSPPEMRATRFF